MRRRHQPVAGAVQLNPVDDPKLAGLYPDATVELDGSFRLTTHKTHDGAPAGTYGLTVKWPLPPRPNREECPDRFQGRHSDPRGPVRHFVDTTLGGSVSPFVAYLSEGARWRKRISETLRDLCNIERNGNGGRR